MTREEFNRLGLWDIGKLEMLEETVYMCVNPVYGITYELHRKKFTRASYYHYGYNGKIYKKEKDLLEALKDVPFDPSKGGLAM